MIEAPTRDDPEPDARPSLRERLAGGIRSHHVARLWAALLAATLAALAIVWVWNTYDWLDQCDHVPTVGGVCEEPPLFLPGLLFGVALFGAALAIVVAGYLGRFARTGRLWRRAPIVTRALSITMLNWLAIRWFAELAI